MTDKFIDLETWWKDHPEEYDEFKPSTENESFTDPQWNPSFAQKLSLVLKYPEMIEAIYDVLDYGIKKGYDAENWLESAGKRMSRKENSDSMFHHLGRYYAGEEKDESGLDHRAHLATRALMGLTRKKRGIEHQDD